MAEVASIMLHKPFSVSFTVNGERFAYLIDIGGLRSVDGDVIHETPAGSFSLRGKCLEQIQDASATLGARITGAVSGAPKPGE